MAPNTGTNSFSVGAPRRAVGSVSMTRISKSSISLRCEVRPMTARQWQLRELRWIRATRRSPHCCSCLVRGVRPSYCARYSLVRDSGPASLGLAQRAFVGLSRALPCLRVCAGQRRLSSMLVRHGGCCVNLPGLAKGPSCEITYATPARVVSSLPQGRRVIGDRPRALQQRGLVGGPRERQSARSGTSQGSKAVGTVPQRIASARGWTARSWGDICGKRVGGAGPRRLGSDGGCRRSHCGP
ncbi:hypothetical protein SAMN05421637_1723 [Demequina mangrovi]|uniref:Uncharacterized protein n=1 Tax=Demequina mangrovi TaxID=1043493 RepID=A0A1H6YFY4_9MICO|nr:hypothetical protein SAMN05421637_1723 [Demequina mangrovi]